MTLQLTDGDSAVGADQVHIGLGDGSHTDLVIASGEEGGKRAGKCNRAVPGGAANGHSHLQQQVKTSVSITLDNGSERMGLSC